MPDVYAEITVGRACGPRNADRPPWSRAPPTRGSGRSGTALFERRGIARRRAGAGGGLRLPARSAASWRCGPGSAPWSGSIRRRSSLARARALAAGIERPDASTRATRGPCRYAGAELRRRGLPHLPVARPAAGGRARRGLAGAASLAARLAILEGDYATTTVAIAPEDPLQACAEAAMAALVNDRWLVRRLPRRDRGRRLRGRARSTATGIVQAVRPGLHARAGLPRRRLPGGLGSDRRRGGRGAEGRGAPGGPRPAPSSASSRSPASWRASPSSGLPDRRQAAPRRWPRR